MRRTNPRVSLGMLALLALLLPFHSSSAQRADTLSPRRAVLDTVRVTSRSTASVAGATRSTEVLTRADLGRLAGRSLADVLSRALGADVQSRSPAQGDLALRGSSFNQVVVLVDGVRVSDVQSGHYALDLAVPTALVERIEILRGTGSALYGSDAVGGVVNIVTRDDGARRHLAVRGGSFGGVSASGAASGDAGGLRVTAGVDGDRSSGHRAGTDYTVTQARASLSRPTPAGRLRLDAGQGLRRFGAANFYSPYPSDETTRSTTAALRLDGDESRRVAVSAAAHTRRHRDLFTLKRDQPAFYQNEHLSWETGGDVTARARLAPAATLAAGAEVLDARLRSARLGDHAQLRRALFGELTVGARDRAVLDAGLRGDRVDGAGSFLSPSLAVALPLARATAPAAVQLRASAGRGFRAPTWTERYYRDPSNVADSSLGVERFWSGEAGLRASDRRGRLSADVALFQRQASDLIDWARPAGSGATTPWRTRNFASARYRGAEASVRAPGALGVDWTLRASGLRLDARAADGVEGKYALRPLTRSLGAVVTHSLGAAGAVTVDVERARRVGERAHTQLAARATGRLRPSLPGLRASVELLNLANARYLDVSGQPSAGRSLFVGLAWERGDF